MSTTSTWSLLFCSRIGVGRVGDKLTAHVEEEHEELDTGLELRLYNDNDDDDNGTSNKQSTVKKQKKENML